MTAAVLGRFGRIRLPSLLAGLLLVVAFYALDNSSNTIRVRFVPPWDASARGELYFWLGATFFLLPGATLIGASLSQLCRPAFERAVSKLEATQGRERIALWATLGIVAWSLARIGNQAVMLGQPFTDDEDAAHFGGQVLASGSLWAPLPPMRFAFPDLFLFQRGSHWTSFDFPGALLPWTFAELTGSDTLVFSLFACLVPVSVAVACARRQGTSAGLLAGGLLLCSPMAVTLSMTSHTHVVSRGLLALGFGLILFVDRPTLLRSLAAGLAFGCAIATRPAESTLLLTPLCLAWSYDALREPVKRPRLLGLLLGAGPVVLALLAYNHALTDTFGFPRSALNDIPSVSGMIMRSPLSPERFWPRFGNNFSYNLLTLSIWYLGPVGLYLAWLGVHASREHELLGAGVLLALCLALLHDDRGLHMVGPVHLSELAVPLTLLAVAGIPRVLSALEKVGVARAHAALAFAGYVVLGLNLFTSWHAIALRDQALARLGLSEMIEAIPERPAVVLAGPFERLRTKYTLQGGVGSFVYEWRRARPDWSEPVLILHDSERAQAEVGRAFPARTAYVFDPGKYGPHPKTLREAREGPPVAAPLVPKAH